MIQRHPPVHVQRFLDEIEAALAERQQWLKRAAENIRRWKAEDEKNGSPWA